jgi:hypothetical protein
MQLHLTRRWCACRLIEAAYDYIIVIKFSGAPPDDGAPAALAHVAPVLAEPDPNDPHGFEAETKAMAAAMQASLQEGRARNGPDACADAGELWAKFPRSALLAALAGGLGGEGGCGALLAARVRPATLKLLKFEANCFRWWPSERGVAPYFATLSPAIAEACPGARLAACHCASLSAALWCHCRMRPAQCAAAFDSMCMQHATMLSLH